MQGSYCTCPILSCPISGFCRFLTRNFTDKIVLTQSWGLDYYLKTSSRSQFHVVSFTFFQGKHNRKSDNLGTCTKISEESDNFRTRCIVHPVFHSFDPIPDIAADLALIAT